jgi:hypothetical protein
VASGVESEVRDETRTCQKNDCDNDVHGYKSSNFAMADSMRAIQGCQAFKLARQLGIRWTIPGGEVTVDFGLERFAAEPRRVDEALRMLDQLPLAGGSSGRFGISERRIARMNAQVLTYLELHSIDFLKESGTGRMIVRRVSLDAA